MFFEVESDELTGTLEDLAAGGGKWKLRGSQPLPRTPKDTSIAQGPLQSLTNLERALSRYEEGRLTATGLILESLQLVNAQNVDARCLLFAFRSR